MSNFNYYELLKHPLWQRKRLEIMQRDEFACSVCYDNESMLNVHHKRYIKNRKPWEYEAANLVTLCASCHKQVHATKDVIDDVLSSFGFDGPYSISSMIAMIVGYAGDAVPSHLVDGDVIDFTYCPEFAMGEVCRSMEFYLGHQGLGRLKRGKLSESDINSLVALFVANYSRLGAPNNLPYPDAGFTGERNEL